MSRQILVVILGAVVLFAVAVVGTMAFTGGSESGANVHTMRDGTIMTGPMDRDDSMMDDSMGMRP